MRSVGIACVMFICMLFFDSIVIFAGNKAYYNEGSLKIDTELYRDSIEIEKEDTYIEQETELIKLFDRNITSLTSEKKEREALIVKYNKDSLFLKDYKKEDTGAYYRNNLFLSKRISENKEISIKSLKTDKTINVYVLVIVGISFTIMITSIAYYSRKKGIKNE